MVELPPAQVSMSVLIVDDEAGIRSFLQKALSKRFVRVETAGSVEEAEPRRRLGHFDLLIVDISLPGKNGIEWHEAMGKHARRPDVIFMTGFADLETAIRAFRAGAADFILKPFRLEQMMLAVDRCIERRLLRRENLLLRREVAQANSCPIIGSSTAMVTVKSLIRRVAPTNASVLIQGESGTGKELIARTLHQLSERQGAFVPFSCGAIATDKVESELFGHLAGIHTGASKSKEGLFSFASGGTVFLDEISELDLAMQAALLRLLEQRTIRPVGSEIEHSVDVRVIAASNRNLQFEVREGRFRADLLSRLDVMRLVVPPLRQRREDIKELVAHFNPILAVDLGVAEVPWSEKDCELLADHDWPGNIRELRNLVERCLLLGEPPAEHWNLSANNNDDGADIEGYEPDVPLKMVERQHITKVLLHQNGNKSAAARVLGVSRKTLDRKFKEWQQSDQE